jgi:hypothetical protein
MESFLWMKYAGLELYRQNMNAALDLFDKSIGILDTPGARLVKASNERRWKPSPHHQVATRSHPIGLVA